MIDIVDYEEKYAKEMSDIILSNMYTINIKDHGKEIIDKIAVNFTTEEIKKNFPNREKCFVALQNNVVVGTVSLAKFRGDTTGRKFIILTVFVNIINQRQGIGKQLIDKIENYAKSIGVKTLVIPSSVYACEFYRKLGYDYINGKKEQNEEKEFMLEKHL